MSLGPPVGGLHAHVRMEQASVPASREPRRAPITWPVLATEIDYDGAKHEDPHGTGIYGLFALRKKSGMTVYFRGGSMSNTVHPGSTLKLIDRLSAHRTCSPGSRAVDLTAGFGRRDLTALRRL